MRARVWLTAAAMLVAVSACEPEAGGRSGGSKPSAGSYRNPAVAEGDCRARPSVPYASSGPRPDGPGLYMFTSTAEGLVNCSRRIHQIKVTVVFHHQTNGSRRGAVTGRDHLCSQASYCDGEAIHSRNRLNCAEYYRYDDYTQITGWYVAAQGGAQVTIDSVDSRHRIATSHAPPEGGCK